MRTKLLPAWHDSCRLRAEGNKLHAGANKLWAAAVDSVCGKDATTEQTDTGCIVMGIMEFIYERQPQGEVK
jgi:hypothetical protein